jgi:DNA-binding NarL/FixJ family response regulator
VAKVLLIDDSAHVNELFAKAIEESLGHDVSALTLPSELTDEFLAENDFDVAVVDLSFGTDEETGLDALLQLHLKSPNTKLMVLTQGDGWVGDLLRDAWEVLPLAGLMSKSSSVKAQIDALDLVVRHGEAPIDPVLLPMLPAKKSPWRTLEGFSRLVQHKGHAKLWAAVLACGPNAEYQDLAAHSGLRLNALRNYRAQLLPELALHGLRNPPMRDLYIFARRCRPFLAPFIEAKGISLKGI